MVSNFSSLGLNLQFKTSGIKPALQTTDMAVLLGKLCSLPCRDVNKRRKFSCARLQDRGLEDVIPDKISASQLEAPFYAQQTRHTCT